MDDQQRHAELVRRLNDAKEAHFQFQETELGGVYDQQWSDWYARFLLDQGWNRLFTREWNAEQLAEALRRADVEQRANAPDAKWQEYYADYFSKIEGRN